MRDVDVVVVGSGAAGLCAALTARAAGARVLVAESEAVVGGATRLSMGMIMAAGTHVQRAAGISDDAANLYHEYLLVNQFEVAAGIARRLADDGAEALAWLAELGVEFFPYVKQGGDERSPRSHMSVGGGQGLVDVLHRRCRDHDIDIALGRRVDRLIVDDGRVRGVAAADDEIRAGAVVLATGGFGAAPELRRRHLPSYAACGDWAYYIGPDSSRGDALALAAQVGANTVGHDRCTATPSARVDGRDFDAFLPGWLLMLGPDGLRICRETSPYGALFGLLKSVGGRAFGIFDARTLADNGSPELPTFKSEFPPGTPVPPKNWSTDAIRRLVASGAIVEGPSVDEVARRLGLPPTAVAGSVRRYNRFAAAGFDADHRKERRFLRPVERPPFYGVELRPAALGVTSYGVETDHNGAVLNTEAGEIDGFFAAGECTGGVLGPRYLGSGNSIANCVVFGRAAGRAAAHAAVAQVDSLR